MTTPRKAAFLARQASPPEYRDGNIASAGIPDDVDTAEVEEVPAAPESPPEAEVEVADEEAELSSMTVPELKEYADYHELEYDSGIHKADLIELIASTV